MARKAPNTAKAVVWTERSRSEMEGPTKAIVYYMFMAVPGHERVELLEDCRKWHEENTPQPADD